MKIWNTRINTLGKVDSHTSRQLVNIAEEIYENSTEFNKTNNNKKGTSVLPIKPFTRTLLNCYIENEKTKTF